MNQEGDQSAFKTEVKQWLKSHGFDYRWMAEQCGVSEITVRNWMSQKNIPLLKQRLIERVMVQMPANQANKAQGAVSGVQVEAALSLTVKLTPELYGTLEAKAAERGVPPGELVAQAIAELLEDPPAGIGGIKTRKVILPKNS